MFASGISHGCFFFIFIQVSGFPLKYYWISTWIGMAPELVIWVYFGHSAGTLEDIISGRENGNLKIVQKVLFIVGLVIAIIVIGVLVWVGRRAMKRAIEAEEQGLIGVDGENKNEYEFTEQEQGERETDRLLDVEQELDSEYIVTVDHLKHDFQVEVPDAGVETPVGSGNSNSQSPLNHHNNKDFNGLEPTILENKDSNDTMLIDFVPPEGHKKIPYLQLDGETLAPSFQHYTQEVAAEPLIRLQ
jgi:hypothetical protein